MGLGAISRLFRMPVFCSTRHGMERASRARCILGRATGDDREGLSRRDPAGFWRDVFLNGTQIEALWREHGGLTTAQRTALADIYNGAAHGLFRHAIRGSVMRSPRCASRGRR